MATIDLNVDAGESFGPWKMGQDAEVFRWVSSVNVACGFHAGDPQTMQATLELARQNGLGVGAHPGFPDLSGFGRREMEATPEEVYADVLYQIGALWAFLKVAGLSLHHVKAHGALYNRATRHAPTAQAIASASRAFDPQVPLVVLLGTPLEAQAQALGLPLVLEAFPERAYTQDGRLAPRSMAGSWIEDPNQAARRAVQMVTQGWVEAIDGGRVAVQAQTLCIHGDNPNAARIARTIRQALHAEGIAVQSY